MCASSLKFATEINFSDRDFVDLGFHETQTGVLPLVHVKNGVIRPLGTCFSITNDGLCMTARHVIEEGVQAPDGISYKDLDEKEDGYFGALYISSEEHPENPDHILGGFLPMDKVYFCNGLDIALFKLKLPVNELTGEMLRFPLHQLRLSLPGVGEPFFSLGYRTMDWQKGMVENGYDVSHKYSASRGQVEELHAGGRDRSMLPYPCFRTSARLDGGMSGGPLVDNFGRVFGVVCSSFGTASDDGYISYASLIGPAMAMTLEVADEVGGEVRKAFLWELVEGGAILADQRGFEVNRVGDEIKIVLGQSLALNSKLGA
ncbi:serine protease [Azospirillum sp. 11R-A]|uniref:S1 family peptidase n=1 Tax=Azospirillum sp. 11R-A TaxID=3111634 RepID=UPI003C260391